MKVLTIPLPTSPLITQSVSLEGISYVMRFDWNSRTDRWSLSMKTEDGIEVINGALLQTGVDILRTVPATLAHVPPGELRLAGDGDPTLTTLPGVTLFYVTSE